MVIPRAGRRGQASRKLTGDRVGSLEVVATPGHSPGHVAWDKAKNLESADILRALDPAVLAVGHGPAHGDPGPAMDRAIARAARKLGPARLPTPAVP
jgi:glyoxylase-like metal-dependent hydrolase (beta-lactamase superfamily II)